LPNKTSSDWANRGESVESWGKEQGAQSKEHGAYARQATKVRKLKVFQKSMQKSPEKEWLKWLENGKWGGRLAGGKAAAENCIHASMFF